MHNWEIRKKHHDDITAVHQKLGHMDSRGNIRTFRGKPFFEEIRKLGHTASILERCQCWQERKSRITGH